MDSITITIQFFFFFLLISLIFHKKGVFTIQLITSQSEVSSLEILDNSETEFKKSAIDNRLISVNTALKGKIVAANVSYKKTSNILIGWMYDDTWMFKSIEVFSGEGQSLVKLCPTPTSINPNLISYIAC
jgi:hypothetical protein